MFTHTIMRSSAVSPSLSVFIHSGRSNHVCRYFRQRNLEEPPYIVCPPFRRKKRGTSKRSELSRGFSPHFLIAPLKHCISGLDRFSAEVVLRMWRNHDGWKFRQPMNARGSSHIFPRLLSLVGRLCISAYVILRTRRDIEEPT